MADTQPTSEQILDLLESKLAELAENQRRQADTQQKLASLLGTVKAELARRHVPLRPIIKAKAPLDEGIVNYVKERGQAGLSEMAKAFGESRALVHYHAKKLAGAGKIALAYKPDKNKRITLQASDPEIDGAQSL